MNKPMFRTDEEIEASIQHLSNIKQAMKDGKLAKSQDDMKGNLPKMMFSERTAEELLQAMQTIKHFKSQVEELENFATIVRDTLQSKANDDRTSWSLWNEANKLVPRKDTP